MHLAWMPQGYTIEDLVARTNWCKDSLPENFWFTTRAVRQSYVSDMDADIVQKHDVVFCFYRKEDWSLFMLTWGD